MISPRPRRNSVAQRALTLAGVAGVLVVAVVAAVFWLHGLSGADQTPGANGLGPIQRAQATQYASATRTTLASIPPTPTVALPPAPGNGATPSWRTVTTLASISGDSGMTGRFLARAGAHARLQWTCQVATTDPTGLTLGCSATLVNVVTGARVAQLVDTTTNASGSFPLPATTQDTVYAIDASVDNENFTATYQVYL